MDLTSDSITPAEVALRRPNTADAPFLEQLVRDPAVRRYLGGVVADPPTHVRAVYLAAGVQDVWIVERVADLCPLGVISFEDHRDGDGREVSYQFAPAHWGQGYAQRALAFALRRAMSQGHPHIVAETQRANVASRSLLGRLGFRAHRHVQRYGAAQIIYKLTKDDAGRG